MSNEQQQNNNKPQLTRIPLDQVWFRAGEEQDFPGNGNSMQPAVIFGVPKVKGRQYFLGFFVPSYQVVDVEYYQSEGAEPVVFPIPLGVVKRMKRSARK